MIIGSYKRLNQIDWHFDPEVNLGGYPIQRVRTSKSLGVMMDETLTWTEHINMTFK